MNDAELITAVRESVADIHTATPLARIQSRGRTVRARRRIPAVAAALAAAAGAAITLTALPAASHPASHPHGGARLTAWSVVKLPGGKVSVTIHELLFPAGLQRKLRAAGVPASVTFDAVHSYPRSCRAYPASRAVLAEVFPPHPGAPAAVVVIHPAALPPGAGVYLDDLSNPYGYIGIQVGLVRASKQCTGS
jgi:hypothetical protein